MEIYLQRLKDGDSMPVQNTYDPKVLELEFVDLKYTEPVTLEGTVERILDTITFYGFLRSRLQHLCGRCLKVVPDLLDKSFSLYYEIQGREVIDTTDDLREIILLDYPLTYVCTEACKGLCPVCAANRNEKECRCDRESDHPLSKLKDIWDKKKEQN